ncbi:MAG: GNAT family N-acetyltransferase [Actinobacteria bacterium]|nr:GNAT family N-acetyltransferase [Actinomycetota bacterium]
MTARPAAPGLRREELERLIEEHQRELAVKWTRIQGGEVEESPELTRYIGGLPVSFTNGVQATRLEPGRVDERIRESVDAFRRAGVPALWWVGPLTRPSDLGDALRSRGFHHEEDMPWLAVDIDAAVDPSPVGDLRIVGVSEAAEQEEWLGVMTRGFAMSDAERRAMISLADAVGYGPGAEWLRFVGRVGGRPVTTSGVMFGGGIAGLYNVTTVPEMRGRGYGGAMTFAALRAARDRGYEVAALGSSPMAIGLYRRMGFRDVCEYGIYRWG